MRSRNRLVLIFSVLVIAVLILYLSVGHIIIHSIARANNLYISYKSLKVESFTNFKFNDFKIIDDKNGIGLMARRADIKLRTEVLFFKLAEARFDLSDVRFIRKAPEGPERYDTLSGLVYAPFNGRWAYKDISGNIVTLKDGGLRVKDFVATSADIKLSLSGDLHDNDVVKTDITISFSSALTGKIPDELANVVLAEEPDGWKSLQVHLEGNYKTPSIQLSSKLFRLNIKTIVPSK